MGKFANKHVENLFKQAEKWGGDLDEIRFEDDLGDLKVDPHVDHVEQIGGSDDQRLRSDGGSESPEEESDPNVSLSDREEETGDLPEVINQNGQGS